MLRATLLVKVAAVGLLVVGVFVARVAWESGPLASTQTARDQDCANFATEAGDDTSDDQYDTQTVDGNGELLEAGGPSAGARDARRRLPEGVSGRAGRRLLGRVKPVPVPADKVGMYDFDTRLIFRVASALLALVLLVGAVVLLLARTGMLGPSPAEVALHDAHPARRHRDGDHADRPVRAGRLCGDHRGLGDAGLGGLRRRQPQSNHRVRPGHLAGPGLALAPG
jgi:hypothetical protein